MSENINCHSCGASCKLDNTKQYIICEYCGGSISQVAFFKNVSVNTIEALAEAGLNDEESKKVSRLFENGKILFDSCDYEKARDQFEKILEIYPKHIDSRLHCVMCVLHDKNLSFTDKGDIALNYYKAIDQNLITPELNEIISGISYNVASLSKSETNSMIVFELFATSVYIQKTFEDRDKIIAQLNIEGIYPGIHYFPPSHKQSVYESYAFNELKNTNEVTKKILSLPIYPELTINEAEYVCAKFNQLLRLAK